MKLKEILEDYIKEEYEILIGPLNDKEFKKALGSKEYLEPEERDPFYEGFVRGVMTIDGTLYIMSDSTQNMHTSFVRKLNSRNIISNKYLRDWPTNNNSFEEFVCVLSYNNKLWGIPGTYSNEGMPKQLYRKYLKHFNDMGYKFTPREIDNET